MKAMILAAGLGSRLRPLTDRIPKALLKVDGVPLLEHTLRKLIAVGVDEVIINLHHLPQQIRAFLKARNHFGIRIEYSEEETLLDTGGGLKHAARFFDDGLPFLLHNVDILSDINLTEMMQHHNNKDNLATLAVNARKTSRYFLFDENLLLCGWKSLSAGREIISRDSAGPLRELAFCGIHVLSSDIFGKLREKEAFSIVDTYLRLAGEGERIVAFPVPEAGWRDAGKPDQIDPGQ